MADFKVKLTRRRYESKVNAHSQYVRWMRAAVCYCVDSLGSVDPNCPSCVGRGYIYSHQTELDVFGEASEHCGYTVYTKNHPLTAVQRVYRAGAFQRPYDIIDFVDGHIIHIDTNPNMPSLPSKDDVIAVDYSYSLEKPLLHCRTAKYLGGNVLDIPLPVTVSLERQELTGDITTIIELKNVTKNLLYDMKSTFKNQVILDLTSQMEPSVDDEWDVSVKYIVPWSFLLNQISERMRFEDAYVATDGDASLTILYPYYVGVGDIIIQCIGEQRASAVLQVTTNLVDVLPVFDVSSIVRFDDGTGVQYKQNTDYVLRNGNQIVWLPTGQRPEGKYSVMFMYHPAFKVFNVKPTVRTPENIRMPRRATLTIYDKVNPNEDLHRLQEVVR